MSQQRFSLPERTEMVEARLKQLEGLMAGMSYSMQRIAQTEMQDRLRLVPQSETQFGMYTALCVDTIDVWKQNRVRFFCPLYHDPFVPIKALPWAFPISAMGGFDDCGLSWVPPAGSTLCLVFEGGSRNSPFYIGTTWSRNRGPIGKHNWDLNIDEYYQIWESGRNGRSGYLVGPDDGSQVLPPWNTESYNGFDLNSISDFNDNPEAQKRITYPNIYGFKTPEKHMFKMVDGDPKCNRKWKRIEILSSCGNWMIFKDDHLHYGGQWAHPICGAGPDGNTACHQDQYGNQGSNPNPSEDITRNPLEGIGDIPPQIDLAALISENIDISNIGLEDTIEAANQGEDDPLVQGPWEKTTCQGQMTNEKIIGGHPRTPGGPCNTKTTKYMNSQVGANPFFKHMNECRPYRAMGVGANKCDLPQSGIQIMSISGHTIVMDDSVEEPQDSPLWEKSLRPFDLGCNKKYLGWMYFRSATGHQFTFDDTESCPGVRGRGNGFKLVTANGNRMELNDHTECVLSCEVKDGGQCPPNYAGDERGVKLVSSSTHTFFMCDHGNLQCAPCRSCGVPPQPKADKAYILLKSGYGLELRMVDDDHQEKTNKQYMHLYCPQKDNKKRGPHMMRFQEKKTGPGQITLRAGGDYIVSTYDNLFEVVGDKDNPSVSFEQVSKHKMLSIEKDYINKAQTHFFIADKQILLAAGKDCPDPETGDLGPCLGPVLVFANNCVKLSDRVFATASPNAPNCNIFMFDPFCSMAEEEEEEGSGGGTGGTGGTGGGGTGGGGT